jgi:hypothetical protein
MHSVSEEPHAGQRCFALPMLVNDNFLANVITSQTGQSHRQGILLSGKHALRRKRPSAASNRLDIKGKISFACKNPAAGISTNTMA